MEEATINTENLLDDISSKVSGGRSLVVPQEVRNAMNVSDLIGDGKELRAKWILEDERLNANQVILSFYVGESEE